MAVSLGDGETLAAANGQQMLRAYVCSLGYRESKKELLFGLLLISCFAPPKFSHVKRHGGRQDSSMFLETVKWTCLFCIPFRVGGQECSAVFFGHEKSRREKEFRDNFVAAQDEFFRLRRIVLT